MKEYLKKELDCYLFWLGGFITIVWAIMLLGEAFGWGPKNRPLTGEDSLTFIVSLSFLIGFRWMRKHLNHSHDREEDKYIGEIWAALLIIVAFWIIFSYNFLGTAESKPKELYRSIVGVCGLFGVTKASVLWKFVKEKIIGLK